MNHRWLILLLAALTTFSCSKSPEENPDPDPDIGTVTPTDDAGSDGKEDMRVPVDTVSLRVATYNASMFRQSSGELAADLAGGEDEHARQVAEVLQVTRPDVVLINEFDWDADGESARLFADEYLAVSQNGAESIEYAHFYVPPTNTGLHSGVDLNGDGEVVSTPGSQQYGDDAFGFGEFHGQYGMVVYSRHPIQEAQVRTFQELKWSEMPDNQLPLDFYSADAIEVFRLSSKNHVDVPVSVDGTVVHLLASHPTPPSFDGDEDRNGRRNNDEIRFWVDYLSGGEQAGYIVDDAGAAGGLDSSELFVVVGDLNSDPNDGDSRREALTNLLAHPRVQDPLPKSEGASAAAESQGQANTVHDGDHALDTANFNPNSVGNLRVDYALPVADLTVDDHGVFWPAPDAEHSELVKVSDHRLVWIDLSVPVY